MTQVPGIQSRDGLPGILPYAVNTPAPRESDRLGMGGTSDAAPDDLVPGGYMSMQFRPDLWIGMSVNSPFGLSVNFPRPLGWPLLCLGSHQSEDL